MDVLWMHMDVVVQPRHLQIRQTVPTYFSPLSHSLWVTTVSFCLVPCPGDTFSTPSSTFCDVNLSTAFLCSNSFRLISY